MVENIRENKKIISLIFIGLITVAMFVIFLYSYLNRDKGKPTSLEKRTMNLNAREIINESRTSSNILSEVNKNDFSNLLLVQGASVELQNADIIKNGDASDNDKSRSIGTNSAIVTSFNSQLSMYNSNIETNGVGSNGFYVTGSNAKATISDSDIKTNAYHSAALVAANKGVLNANHVSVYTKSVSSPAIDIVNKDANANIVNTLFETSGALSPIVNASGQVTVDRSTGNSYSSNIAILKDTGNVYFKESTFIAAGGGLPEGFSETGILIYGDNKQVNPQLFSTINSSLNIDKNYPFYRTASMFNIVNTNAVISLTNTSFNFGSGVLAYIKDSNVVINTSGQVLNGSIIMDNKSSLELSLKYNSSYEFALNNENTKISLGINSRIKLLGDTYIGSLINEDATNSNIDLNGYNLYVNGTLFLK